MNEELIADLKQFIVATVSQSTSDLQADIKRLDTKIDGLDAKIDGVEQRLTAKLDEVRADIGDAITTSNDVDHARLEDHERRLKRLEHRAA